jgi:hypothetical protein
MLSQPHNRSLAPLALVLAGASLIGCGDDTAAGSGGAGGDGAAAGTTTAATTDASSTSDAATTTTADATSTATGGACTPDANDACEVCTAETCCDAWTACEADQGCWDCVTGTDDSLCAAPGTHDRVTEYLECIGGPCVEPCIGASGDCEDANAAEYFGDECGACLEQNCCDEVGACYEHGEPDEGCWYDCVTNHNAAGCHEPTAHALYYAIGECAQTNCEAECIQEPVEPACEGVPEEAPSAGACVEIAGGDECNPVTNEGCDTEAGEACDSGEDGFMCYPPPNENALCTECSEDAGFCAPGHVCVGGLCARWCCTDQDCGDDGVCSGEGNIGYCIVPAD